MRRLRCGAVILLVAGHSLAAQEFSKERTFPQPKTRVEKAIQTLRASTSGRLPIVEGFVTPGELPLNRFQRAYYQSDLQVTAVSPAISLVRITAKITAWYADPVPAHSGYQILLSNGRLENDLLDQLADLINGSAPSATAPSAPKPSLSAPLPRIPDSPERSVATQANSSLKTQTDAAEKNEQELAAEAKGLEEILQNQSHPANLVAVKQAGTPVLQSANANAKVLFDASVGDEFELLDENSSWVHVRISGLSRGWILRSKLEMPGDAANSESKSANPVQNAGSLKVSNEQIAPFPADWEPLRGKIVKIITVQKAAENTQTNSKLRLEFAKSVLMKQYDELYSTPDPPAGVVLIVDSDDGGMIAATLVTLKNWQAGAITDDAAWRQCFFDPPELLGTK